MTAPARSGAGRRLVRALAMPAAVLLRHPLTTLALGLGLFAVGMIELFEGLFEEFETIVESHHGFILFGAVTTLRGLIELLETAEFFAMGESELERQDAEGPPPPDRPT